MSGLFAAALAVPVGGLLVVLTVAVSRRDGAAVVNALVSLAVVPVALVAAAGFQSPIAGPLIAPALPVWAAVASLLHAAGMLGPYESIWWWDHLTHSLSAALATALIYAAAVVAWGGSASSVGLAAVAVGYIAVLGIAWELLELVARALGERYGVEPVLVHYGWSDTALDIGFDVVGAAVVVGLNLRVFVDLAGRYPDASAALLSWTAGGAVVGTAVMALALFAFDAIPTA